MGFAHRPPPFNGNNISENSVQRVELKEDASYFLSQTTDSQPCRWKYATGEEHVKETDLFVSPNNKRNAKDFPQSAINDSAKLSTMRHIFHHIQLKPRAYRSEGLRCKTSQAAFITAIVLTNPTSKQTFFYQIRLGVYRGGSVAGLHDVFPPAWFFSGTNVQNGLLGQYGFGDNVTTFDYSFAEGGRWNAYRLDVFHLIKALIMQGARHGMDQDLSNWVLSGTYHGLIAMGDISIAGEWRGFVLAFK